MASQTKRRNKLSDLGFKIWGAMVFTFLFGPIAVIVAYSFNNGRVLAQFTEFGFDAYVSAINNNVIVSSVITSLQAAFLSALLATFLGSLGGIALARARRKTFITVGLMALLAVSLMTPEVVDGIAYLPWFVTLGVDANLTMFNNGL